MNIIERKPRSSFDFGGGDYAAFPNSRRRPLGDKLILWSAALMTLVYAIGGFLVAGPYLDMIPLLGDIENQDTAALSRSLWAAVPGYFVLMFGTLIVMVMAETTMHRAVQRSENTEGIPLRFGRDEVRVLGASLGVWLLGFIGFFLFLLAIVIVGAIIASAIDILGMIIIGLGYFAALLFWVFVVIRLSPAAALSVRQEKAHLMAGRKISKYRFWPMFLAFLLVGFVGYIISYILSLIGMMALVGEGAMFLSTGGEFGGGNPEDIIRSLQDKFSNPLMLIGVLIGGFFYCVFYVTWLLSMAGIGSYIVKWWAEEDEASPFD